MALFCWEKYLPPDTSPRTKMLPQNLPANLIPELEEALSQITPETSPKEVAGIVITALIKHRDTLNSLSLSAPDLTSILTEARPRAWRPAVATIKGYAKDAGVTLVVGPRGNGLAERAKERRESHKSRIVRMLLEGAIRTDILAAMYNRRSPQDAGRLNELLREIVRESSETNPKLSAMAKKLLEEKVCLNSSLCGPASAGRHHGHRGR